MTHHFNGHINLLPVEEQQLRLGHLRAAMATARVDAILVSDIANIYYLTGRVFSGYVYVTAEEMPVVYFVNGNCPPSPGLAPCEILIWISSADIR